MEVTARKRRFAAMFLVGIFASAGSFLPADLVLCFGADGHRALEAPHLSCCGRNHVSPTSSTVQMGAERQCLASCVDLPMHYNATPHDQHQGHFPPESQAAKNDVAHLSSSGPLLNVRLEDDRETTHGKRLTELRSVVLLT